MKEVTICDKSKALTIGTKIGMADSFLSRLVGLLGRRRLDSGCGILIGPSSGVHTIGMLFSIDVVALDKHLRVLKVWPRLHPFRVTSISLKVHSVLELVAGEIERLGITVGDELEVLSEAQSVAGDLDSTARPPEGPAPCRRPGILSGSASPEPAISGSPS